MESSEKKGTSLNDRCVCVCTFALLSEHAHLRFSDEQSFDFSKRGKVGGMARAWLTLVALVLVASCRAVIDQVRSFVNRCVVTKVVTRPALFSGRVSLASSPE